ncbi:hypothetical protein NPIL_327001 [Nephila pilipes]|uniref:Uncharacterized protein n=1 Tax=Nephila pilipes TaxID=299642 RepID=A0A8X6TZA1_NEPPI|nr:hypothetical protein NPIL_327001 [Nephila pilipes]
MNVHRIVVFAHLKRITEHNSHSLAGEPSGSSISNGRQAKNDRLRQLAGVGTKREEVKLPASVAKSRFTAFLASATPWESYFKDNPRTTRMINCLGSYWGQTNFRTRVIRRT